MKIVDKNTFSEIEKCNCGKDVFRYHNTSRNVYVAKCSNYTHDYNRVLKNWNDCKKKPCDFHYVYHGERPVHIEKIKEIVTKKCMEVSLEEKLRLLFSFLFVSNHSSTLDEINIIVRNQLKREPRKTFYFPTTTKNIKISHYESFEDYRDRIFSKKIVDLQFIEEKENFKPVHFVNTSLLPNRVIVQEKPKPILKKKIKSRPVLQESSQFIIVSDDDQSEQNSDYETESENTEEESERENSDYEDEIPENYEEVYDDYDDEGGDDYQDEN